MNKRYEKIIINDLLRMELSRSEIDFILDFDESKECDKLTSVCDNIIFFTELVSRIESQFMDKIRVVTYYYLKQINTRLITSMQKA